MLVAYLVRGVKAGVVAGAVFGLLLALVANPVIAFAEDRAHGTHDGQAGGASHTDDHHAGETAAGGGRLPVTDAVSVASGVLWGVLLGVVGFGAAFYLLEPLVPGGPALRSYAFAAAGFVTVSGAPWLALPPSPPGTTHALGVRTRLFVYAAMLLAGALATVGGMALYDRLRDRRGRAVAAAAGLVPLAALPAVAAALPSNATRSALAEPLAAGVTGLAVFGQLLVWLLLAGVHARLHRSDGPEAGPTATPRPDPGVGGD
ncbi:CbtA family protein [Halobaculum sp. CBA1158]|uniref:CbtA family protein n=1 Tax=Halobaculum sp. CBA1158 TaxID=2904243 RepID=UPI001F188E26|nr:CbtA family protein [Halobaculum sp. CBA1158]UIO99833.1 CbtA family protein [Halobaculum sp. CBA1158]